MALEEIIQHFTHPPHPLSLVKIERDWNKRCYCCGFRYGRWSGGEILMYDCKVEPNCLGYDVYLCLLCAGIEQNIVEHHALHPCHPRLKLVGGNSIYDRGPCGACCSYAYMSSDHHYSFVYYCDYGKCDFMLHVNCAHSMRPVLQLPSHSHLLTLNLNKYFAGRSNCESCRRKISARVYARCVPCNLNYHINCDRGNEYRLPEMITYQQGHPQHLLSHEERLGMESYTYSSCDVCCKKRDWHEFFMYVCLECKNFTAHARCIFQSNLIPCPLANLYHQVVLADDLIIKGGPVHEAALCQGCKKGALNGLHIYGCQHCNFVLHESCIRQLLKLTMEEEMTRDHPLVLQFAHGREFRCCLCNRRCSGFILQEKTRKLFVVDVECMLLVPSLPFNGPSLELIGHDHPVVLLQKDNTTKTSYLRCLQCKMNFSITESSCRLPCTLVHECHFHPLTLVSRLVEDEDPDQCYCDVCEQSRDPTECIYHCAECQFEAHIGCVRSQVLGPGANKLKNVKFLTLQEVKENEEKEKKKKKIQIRDIFCLKEEVQLSCAHDHKELNDIFQAASKITRESSIGENLSSNSDVSDKTFYTDKPLKEFIERLKSTSTTALEETRSTLESLGNEEVVRVGEYLVPPNFEEVLETLFDKYGDFGAKCRCSRKVKQYIFVGLCKTIQSMGEVKVVRVTESLLIEWWAWIAVGKAVGFKIEFAMESFRRVVLAHFGLEADKYAIGELRSVRDQMKELQEKDMELTKKLEELTRELDETRRKFKESEVKEKELREEVFRVKKSPLMKKCLKEAEDLTCYTVAETFLPPSD